MGCEIEGQAQPNGLELDKLIGVAQGFLLMGLVNGGSTSEEITGWARVEPDGSFASVLPRYHESLDALKKIEPAADSYIPYIYVARRDNTWECRYENGMNEIKARAFSNTEVHARALALLQWLQVCHELRLYVERGGKDDDE